MPYRVEIAHRAQRQIASFERPLRARVQAAILGLAMEPRPRGCLKMAGVGDRWRIRIGDYRIIYDIDDDRLIVLVVDAGHRREVYRG